MTPSLIIDPLRILKAWPMSVDLYDEMVPSLIIDPLRILKACHTCSIRMPAQRPFIDYRSVEDTESLVSRIDLTHAITLH